MKFDNADMWVMFKVKEERGHKVKLKIIKLSLCHEDELGGIIVKFYAF